MVGGYLRQFKAKPDEAIAGVGGLKVEGCGMVIGGSGFGSLKN